MTTQTLVSHFPVPRPHCGPALGNGLQGLLIWGELSLLITVARAGFWDRRGGQDIPAGTTYDRVRHALERDDGSLAWPDHRKGHDYLQYEICEMDAPLGAAAAILEMLVMCRGDTVHITDRLPKHWRELSFERIRAEGGFEVSGTVRHGKLASLSLHSTRGGELRLEHQLGSAWTLDGIAHDEALLIISTLPGQTLRLQLKH